MSQRALALRTGSDIASARAAIEECNESSFGKAAVVSATTNAGVGRVFRMMVVNNDAQEAVHSSPDASAHMFALLPPGCDDTHVVAQALADEAAFASDTLMSQSNSFLHCLSTCGSCMNSVTPVQHERKPNPPVAKNTTDEQLFEQKPQQEQQDAQPSTAHAHPHTMSNDPAHENTNATEKADNHRQKQLHASAKPMASNKQVKTDANKSSDAKDKMMSMFNKAHKKVSLTCCSLCLLQVKHELTMLRLTYSLQQLRRMQALLKQKVKLIKKAMILVVNKSTTMAAKVDSMSRDTKRIILHYKMERNLNGYRIRMIQRMSMTM